MLLLVDYAADAADAAGPRARVERIDAHALYRGLADPAAGVTGLWAAADRFWTADGRRLDRAGEGESAVWHLADERPDFDVLALRPIGAGDDGRIYFSTGGGWGIVNHDPRPTLAYSPSRPPRVGGPPPPGSAAFAPDVSVRIAGRLVPVPPRPGVTADAAEGAWALSESRTNLLRLTGGRAVALPERPTTDKAEGVVPLDGEAAVVTAGYFAGDPAQYWDGRAWHAAADVDALVHGRAAELAARAGGDVTLGGVDPPYGYNGVALAGDGRGGLWFLHCRRRDPATQDYRLRIEFFDGGGWHDLIPALRAAGIDTRGGPDAPLRPMLLGDGGRSLVFAAALDAAAAAAYPDPYKSGRPPVALWKLRLGDDGGAAAVGRLSEPGRTSTADEMAVVADECGRLWSPHFGPEANGTGPVGAWSAGRSWPGRGEEPVAAAEAGRGPAGRTVVRMSRRAEDALLDARGRLWLASSTFRGGLSQPNGPAPLVFVRLPEATAPAAVPATAPATAPAGTDPFGGRWFVVAVLPTTPEVSASPGRPRGGVRLFERPGGTVWAADAGGLCQFAFAADGPPVVARRLPWPTPAPRPPTVVADGGGVWVDFGSSDFRKRLPVRYVPLGDR